MGDTLPHGAPEFRQISLDMLRLRVVVPPLTCGARHCLGCFLQGLCAVGMDIGAHLA